MKNKSIIRELPSIKVEHEKQKLGKNATDYLENSVGIIEKNKKFF